MTEKENIVFDPKRKDIRFFQGDSKDWAIYDDKCFGINPGTDIGYCPNKLALDVFCKEGYEISREEFAKMYPQVGI